MVNTAYTDFSGGELSPRAYGRFDTSLYNKSPRIMENIIPDDLGAAVFRTGTVYANGSRQNAKPWLYTFLYNDTVSYVLEFTAGYIRFYRNDGLILDAAQSITGITQASPAVVTYSGDDTYSDGDSIIISGVSGMTEVSGEYVVANVNTTSNTFELSGVDSTGYTAYTTGGTIERIIEVATPYSEEDIPQLKLLQDSSRLYIAHPSYAPRYLLFSSSTEWSLNLHEPIRETYGVQQNITAITKASPAVLTYSGADNFSNDDEVYITGVSGMTEVNDTRFLVKNVNTTANTFQLYDPDDESAVDSSAYTTYSSGGIVRKIIKSAAPFLVSGKYPHAVGSYEQRLYYGGSTDDPLTVYASVPADPDDFTIGDEDDDGLQYTISGGSGEILWFAAASSFLVIGLSGDIDQATGGLENAITYSNIAIRPTNAYGAQDINPLPSDNIYYMQATKRALRSIEYVVNAGTYKAVNKNTLSDHITKSGITQISLANDTSKKLWAVRSDGVLAGLTLSEIESVSGWFRITIDGEVVSATQQARDGEYDQTWIAVKRNINGTDRYYIEYFSDVQDIPTIYDAFTASTDFDNGVTEIKTYADRLSLEAQKFCVHLDSSLMYRGDLTGATITPAATTGEDIVFTSDISLFTSDSVGREIWKKCLTGAETGKAVITEYTSATSVKCDIVVDFDSTDSFSDWYYTTDSVSGIDHLEGEKIGVVTDGAQHPELTVSNGSITLERQAGVVTVGKKYIGILELNELEGGGTSGPTQTKKKILTGLGIRLLNTLFFKYGTSYDKLKSVEFRTPQMAMDSPPVLFTGDKYSVYNNDSNDKYDGGWSREKRLIFVQDEPFPFNLQMAVPYFKVSN